MGGPVAEEVEHRRLFDDAPGVHDDDALAELRDHAEVVRDEQDSQAEALLQDASSSMICAWMVTSRAVVGSSAMSSSGSHESAMAIITRWRIPPES